MSENVEDRLLASRVKDTVDGAMGERIRYIDVRCDDLHREAAAELSRLRVRCGELEKALTKAEHVMVNVDPHIGENWKQYREAIDDARALLSASEDTPDLSKNWTDFSFDWAAEDFPPASEDTRTGSEKSNG